jgi:hypothetical protein
MTAHDISSHEMLVIGQFKVGEHTAGHVEKLLGLRCGGRRRPGVA